MKVTIWIHKNDIISGNITEYHNICPQGTHWPNYYQVQVSVDEFARLDDKDKGDTYPEFVEKHYKKVRSTEDLVKQYSNTNGGGFGKFWDSLSIEEKSKIQKEYGWEY